MSFSGPSGGFSLFPNTSTTKSSPSRKQTPRPRAVTPQSLSRRDRGQSIEMTPPRNGRSTPEDLSQFVIDGKPSVLVSSCQTHDHQEEPSISQPVPPSETRPRADAGFCESSTLVRSNSNRSRSSIAKRPLYEASTSTPAAETGFRSIFPQYDHNAPLDRQGYFPTQTSPSHIPRTVISRQSHVPNDLESRSPPVRSPVRSPLSADSAHKWPRRHQDTPVIPPVSTIDELRDYWKAANGWKASSSEGRTFCMKLTAEKDTPIYHLSSTTQPFYHLKINPTSASAYVTLSRHDPNRPYKELAPVMDANSPGGILGALRDSEKNKTWQEAINTTLEEPSRRLPPNDGLIALLYPYAATKMALEKPGDITAVMAAERECARLVWDEDSQNHFLVHPALATPFCITVERNHGWSRTEYTLEHIESPQHLAKLTRDGTGEGWMGIDTLIAGRIDSHYILDVAVCALMIVANTDEKNCIVEQFEPPPTMLPPQPAHLRRSSDRSRSSSRLSGLIGMKEDKRKGKKRAKLEELEIDLESQTSSLGKQFDIKDKNRLPGTTRTVIKLISFAFKCAIWAMTLAFKALMALIVGLSKCLKSEKL